MKIDDENEEIVKKNNRKGLIGIESSRRESFFIIQLENKENASPFVCKFPNL